MAENTPSSPPRKTTLFSDYGFGLLALSFFLIFALILPRGVVHGSNGIVYFPDLFAYLQTVRMFWEQGGNIYAPQFQVDVVKQIAGIDVGRALPFGLSPTAATLLSPFSILYAEKDLAAYGVWNALALLLFLGALYQTAKDRTPNIRRVFFLISVIAIYSSVGVAALALGQTSIWALAFLLFLSRADRLSLGTRAWIAEGLILFALSVKPVYFAAGVVILLSRRQQRPILLGFALSAASLMLVLVRSGSGVFRSYLDTLAIFSSGNVPEVFQNAFSPARLCLFSTSFAQTLGSEMSYKLSNVICVLLCAVLLAKAIRTTRSGEIQDPLKASASFIAAYLLFVPYAGLYEDVLLLIPLFSFVADTGRIPQLVRYFFGCLAALFLFDGIVYFQRLDTVPLWFTRLIILMILTGALGFVPRRKTALA